MSIQEQFPFAAHTLLPNISYPTLRNAIQHRAKEFDLPLAQDSETEIQLKTAYGTYRFWQGDEAPIAEIGSSRSDWLYVLKESLQDIIHELSPEIAKAIHWSDAQESAGNRPPNFQFITIEDVTALAGGFLRVTALAEDLSHFTTDSIHFRLALPDPEHQEPQWPYLSDTGQTIWPKGEAALHRPVYTVRDMDISTSRLTFDIFIHEGGRATAWAQNVTPGTRVGLTGPGGGGIPEVDQITMYADETGFPAVARILEAQGPNASGHVVLQQTCSASAHYPMPTHPGVSIEYVQESDSDLGDLAIETMRNRPDQMIWLAAEKAAAQKLRAAFKTEGLNTKEHYIAAYWTRPAISNTQG